MRYPAAVKLKAVRLHLEEGFNQAMVCQEMAIGSSSLAVWVSRYRQFGEAGLQPQPHADPAKPKLQAPITEQIVALKKENPGSKPGSMRSTRRWDLPRLRMFRPLRPRLRKARNPSASSVPRLG